MIHDYTLRLRLPAIDNTLYALLFFCGLSGHQCSTGPSLDKSQLLLLLSWMNLVTILLLYGYEQTFACTFKLFFMLLFIPKLHSSIEYKGCYNTAGVLISVAI